MKFSKVVVSMVVLFALVPMYAKDKKKPVKKTAPKVQQSAVKQPVVKKPVVKQPAAKPSVVKPVAKPVSMESYINNRVVASQQDLISDIFPSKNTIERIVLDFKNEYPGPTKEADTTLIYNTIINNPEIKKMITLENAAQVYQLLKEAISDIWDKQDELIWGR